MGKQLKTFSVEFHGKFIGGYAVVKAFDRKDAETLFKNEHPEFSTKELQISEIPRTRGVTMLFNGDY